MQADLQTSAHLPHSRCEVEKVYKHIALMIEVYMPLRTVPFVDGEFYHVYNRGVNRRKIFLTERNYSKFIQTIEYYSFNNHRLRFSDYLALSPEIRSDYFNKINEKFIEIVSFVLMPNHFHFLIKQTGENGISKFIRLFQNSYARYFNLKHGRVGHLFQGQFKAVHIDTNEQLLHVSRYIHLNPLTSLVVKSIEELEKYPWSSYPIYVGMDVSTKFVTPKQILEQFENRSSYQKFVSDQVTYQQELELIKHLTLEE
jgi:putative transposase